MKQYHDLLRHILQNGVQRGDRTGTGTISIFGAQMRFDLDKGFPLVTTKRMFTRGMIYELLYFINGVDNNKLLQDVGVRFWDSWGDSNGNLGPMYGHQLTNFGGAYKNIPQPEISKIRYFKLPNGIKDKEVLSSNYGDYVIIDDGIGKHVTVCFLQTGFCYKKRRDRAKNGNIYDPFYNSLYGFGGLGEVYINGDYYKSLTYFKSAKASWMSMINRCYNKNKNNYSYYGGKGVYVCDRWRLLSNFLKDYKYLRGYSEDFENLELDKDIIGNGFCYSPQTCMLVSASDNSKARMKTTYTVMSQDGEIASFTNAADFMKLAKITNQGNFCSMLRGQRGTCHGWSLLNKEDIGVNQLNDVINSIQNNPNSRRHVLTLWNPIDLKYQALHCCHGTVIQFYVSDGKLSCHMYQRSGDFFLGVPVNIASYGLLTQMIAQVCGLGLGDLVITFGDAHIYNNHIEQVKLQLTRQPRVLPKMKINPNVKSIFDFKYEDFELVGYDPHAHIKGEVSV